MTKRELREKPDVPNKKDCKHEWGYFVEEGGIDNRTYLVCVKCGEYDREQFRG